MREIRSCKKGYGNEYWTKTERGWIRLSDIRTAGVYVDDVEDHIKVINEMGDRPQIVVGETKEKQYIFNDNFFYNKKVP